MNKILTEIGLCGIVPVIVIDDKENAIPLAKSLVEGGLPVAEVTFRTKAARESIELISKAYPEMLIGAGTVLTIDQVKAAVDAGAKYIVSPGLNPKVVEYCVVNEISITPGIATPSDIERALEFNLEVVKYFPAESLGGLDYLKAISAPYGNLKFIPTGGIDEIKLLPYLRFTKVLACGGSWMVKSHLIAEKKFDEIKSLTSRAITSMLGFADNEGNSSNFSGGQIELMKQPNLGKNGHIAIGTNFIERAIAYLEKLGYKFNYETKSIKDGKLIAVYFESELGGFVYHLLQN
jgi:2-dehydro-3-deoxyphosphogluconate aldolase/(4S)-4-hydroxy-2-oxoglutarate aldolase